MQPNTKLRDLLKSKKPKSHNLSLTQVLGAPISLHTKRQQANLKASYRALYSLSGTRMNSLETYVVGVP